MKVSNFPIFTQKDVPSEAEITSHQLMIKSGMIRKLSSGQYSWLPMGLRVIQKIEKIIREELNNIGCAEILMPSVQPAELWKESGRWDEYGPELLRFKDRHERDFCMGPTHEEVITNIAKQYIRSYKQLPINFYQIKTKLLLDEPPSLFILWKSPGKALILGGDPNSLADSRFPIGENILETES